MNRSLLVVLAFAALALSAGAQPAANVAAAPSETIIRMSGWRYQLLLNCGPFVLRGAYATNRLQDLAAAGANCVVIPNVEAAAPVLDRAKETGLMGAVVLRLEPAGGLVYTNAAAVASAIEVIRPHVRRLRTHPRLILWILSSEIAAGESENIAAYQAVNALAGMLHDEDPDHAVIAEIGYPAGGTKPGLAASYCPEVDILGWSPGEGMTNLIEVVDGTGWYKPFVVFGAAAPDPASVKHAAWGAPLEPLPAQKQSWSVDLLARAVPEAKGLCLGAVAYDWDPSQLVTPTWHSMHLADGLRTETADALSMAWSGQGLTNHAPVITALTSPVSARIVSAGAIEEAAVTAADADDDLLSYSWVLTKEERGSGDAGRQPARFVELPGAIRDPTLPRVSFTVPQDAGPYRLFVYARDNRGRASGANLPFLVEARRTPAPVAPPLAAAAPAKPEAPAAEEEAVEAVVIGQPAKVTIEKTGVGGGWQMFKDGKPFFVKGAGGKKHLDELKGAGANAIRTWSTDFATAILDDAHRRGLMVCLGLWMKQERHGFDYRNREAVDQQLQKLRAAVRRYRNHPALLMWCCGIEVEWGAGTNVAVYQAINEVARMVHQEDPNHPTTTAFADLGYNNIKAALAAQYCPELDVFGVNSYGGLPTMADRLQSMGWTRPYMIMEFGPRGQWEVQKTSWGAEIEQMPLEKADFYLQSYLKSISSQENWCLGSFVFSWDFKVECTPTWYSMHLLDGLRMNTCDTMWQAWSGRDPTNRCPQLRWVGSSLDRQRVGPNKPFFLDVDVTDPDGDALQYEWLLMAEKKIKQRDGTTATDLKPIGGRITEGNTKKAKIMTPSTPGAYRVFVYVRDGKGNASAANLPFFVEHPQPVSKQGGAATNRPGVVNLPARRTQGAPAAK